MATSDSPLNVPNVTLGVARAAQAAVNGLTLAASNYVSRKLDMIPVHPVDSSETQLQPNASAFFKNARPGLKYEVPIVVAFGAYPFNARKIAGPEWLSVNSDLTLSNGVYTEPPDYMTISGTPPPGSEGSYTVTVGVTDQDFQRGANPSPELQISYTLTVSNSMHVFVAPTATGAGDGSSPDDCAPYTDLYLGETTVSLGKGKIAVWRGGSYSNQFTFLRPQYHSYSHIAYQNEVPDVDLLNVSGAVSIEGRDFCFIGFSFKNGSNKVFASFGSEFGSNSFFWRCKFSNTSRSDTVTNQSCWFTSSENALRVRLFIRECEFSQMGDLSAYIWYSTDKTVAERNTFVNPKMNTTRSIVFPKADNQRHSIRRNVLNYLGYLTSTDAAAFQIYNAKIRGTGTDPLQQEICYNQVFCGEGNGGALSINQSTAESGQQKYSYRNTYVNGYVSARNDPLRGGFSENDVVQNSYGGANPSSTDTSNITGTECQGTTGVVDPATGLLTGSLRTQYLGQRGHEIAGDTV